MPAFVLLNNPSIHCVDFLKVKSFSVLGFCYSASEIVHCSVSGGANNFFFLSTLHFQGVVFRSISINVLLISMKSKVLLIRNFFAKEFYASHVLKHGI
jgi:hypothetical protein